MADAAKRHYPIFLDLNRRPAVVIGEGPVAERRVRQLVRYGADVVVITATPSEALIEAQGDGQLTIEARSYVRGDLNGAFLALCVTEDEEVRRAVAGEAEAIGCLANIAGAPELCSFILPSVVHREPLQIAISTGGMAPGVARDLRKQLGVQFGPEWGPWVTLQAHVHALAMERLESPEQREHVMAGAADSSVLERIAGGEELTAQALFDELTVELTPPEGAESPEGAEPPDEAAPSDGSAT